MAKIIINKGTGGLKFGLAAIATATMGWFWPTVGLVILCVFYAIGEEL